MSTRSLIGKTNPDGSVTYIYCHFDGYPEGVGKTLSLHYQDAAKVDALLALGDISSLGEEIGTKHSFNDRPAGETTAYGRDRGEKGTEAKTVSSPEAFRETSSWTEYWYLYGERGWVRAYEDETWIPAY